MNDDILNTLNTGDVLLFNSSDHWYDWLVKKCTFSHYSHSAMVLRDPLFAGEYLFGLYIIQSDSAEKEDVEDHTHKFGVQIVPIKDIFDSGYDDVYVRRLTTKRDGDFFEKLREAHKDVHNIPYDLNLFHWWTAGMYHLGRSTQMVKKHVDSFWCSALVVYLYSRLGLVDESVDWSNMAPSDIASSNFKLTEGNTLGPVELLFKFK
tara:strand:+ start:407 stop:1024 length:618 start_codon:yes stop_codon:yes gene_type:complete